MPSVYLKRRRTENEKSRMHAIYNSYFQGPSLIVEQNTLLFHTVILEGGRNKKCAEKSCLCLEARKDVGTFKSLKPPGTDAFIQMVQREQQAILKPFWQGIV